MKTRPFLLICALLFPLAGAFAQTGALKSPKKRVAVFVFDDKTDKGMGWFDQKTVGEGVSDMIATELVKSGLYRVIERQQLNVLLAEQDLGASGVVTAESAAKMGQVLGVEIAVVGAVTEFGYKKNETNISIAGKRLGVGAQTAVMALDIRLVNTTTGEILMADNVRRNRSVPSGSIGIGRVSFSNQQSFDETMVGKVAREAVEDVVAIVGKQMDHVAWSAKVITQQGANVYINSGANDGVSAGMVLTVIRKGEPLVDPDTGLQLGALESEVGQVEVVNPAQSEGRVAICKVLKGSGFVKGDIVRIRE